MENEKNLNNILSLRGAAALLSLMFLRMCLLCNKNNIVLEEEKV